MAGLSVWAEAQTYLRSRNNRRFLADVNIFVYNADVKSSEFKRWLSGLGATFEPAKGSHLRVRLNGKASILPMHSKELKKGTAEGIKMK